MKCSNLYTRFVIHLTICHEFFIIFVSNIISNSIKNFPYLSSIVKIIVLNIKERYNNKDLKI